MRRIRRLGEHFRGMEEDKSFTEMYGENGDAVFEGYEVPKRFVEMFSKLKEDTRLQSNSRADYLLSKGIDRFFEDTDDYDMSFDEFNKSFITYLDEFIDSMYDKYLEMCEEYNREKYDEDYEDYDEEDYEDYEDEEDDDEDSLDKDDED